MGAESVHSLSYRRLQYEEIVGWVPGAFAVYSRERGETIATCMEMRLLTLRIGPYYMLCNAAK